ncbi:hypothetical protein IF803_40185 [Bradyrhizobium sp. UFLA06-06]
MNDERRTVRKWTSESCRYSQNYCDSGNKQRLQVEPARQAKAGASFLIAARAVPLRDVEDDRGQMAKGLDLCIISGRA